MLEPERRSLLYLLDAPSHGKVYDKTRVASQQSSVVGRQLSEKGHRARQAY
jgi:hypothetical protein